ncbi:MAG: hypothetical protein IJD02_02310 [Lachnospiraceae bacterium]|nr:hypothetical protein [Lachnospiraceae bacterium]
MKRLHTTINKRLTLICVFTSLLTIIIVSYIFYCIDKGVDNSDFLTIVIYSLPAILLLIGLIFLMSLFVTRKLTNSIVNPVIEMAEHMEAIENHIAYEELLPFARKIKSHDAMRQEFTANVSHELKTPLTSISGYAQLMSAGMVKPEDIKNFSDKIMSESQRLLCLINDIIKLSQLDETSLNMLLERDFKPVNLLSVSEDVVNSLSDIAQNKQVTFSIISNPKENYIVKGDKGLLTELVYNLCDNAIRYNNEGGTITLTISREYTGVAKILNDCVENAFVVLSVRDSGIGIEPEHQPHIFERFYRADKSHSKATGGTGLGLSIVKHIATIHKAFIDLDSEPGFGTEIEVHFPDYIE